MADGQQFIISHKEVAELLVKQQGLHEGVWGLFIRFGLQAANLPFRSTDDARTSVFPAAIIPLIEIGIQPFAELNDLSVDAAVVNPKPKTKRGAKKTAKGKATQNKRKGRVA